MFILSYLIFLDPVVPTHRGNLMSPTVLLDLSLIHTLSLPWAMVFLGGGGSTSCTFPPTSSTYLGYDMPPLFSHATVYHTITQPPYYMYPQPGAPAPPALAPPPPFPSQPPQ